MSGTATPCALITGGARRIGATIARLLHAQGYRILLHYRQSLTEASSLADELNRARPDSCLLLQADLNQAADVERLISEIGQYTERLDLLVNNASTFYPTPLDDASQQDWDLLINSNLRGPFFLTQGMAPLLRQSSGNIVNLVDIHAERGLAGYPVYSIAKAGVKMMTLSLARELAPDVRVNGVSPGAILWPEADAALDDAERRSIVDKIPLKRTGTPDDIAQAVLFLATAPYVTGQVLAVDGGRSVFS
ncbi:pteridine reductase [Marinobacterium sp. AK62]|uniref:Pteridine reductase n=1 Tax=Marinobacterium alkalitolerans TaxID=1542925 RepID=A0ABS3ZAV4_9GAMM|nr:pteridine reductase [Marinobacterium alkalitolerans]MBP0048833.1 pteridine reductase [Marinobacterium alkalitolerans]